ncbi:NAD-dependent epimerase/dehydratase family protein [Chitinophagaceae bacterium LB-8]|uniref:NAD-dependent epimerase/dehydratase family protein n=1 Tax=Paraflavisolibacter caeni TaxID=2982496 RepID=A0A9X3BK82_9BACT|nr:NAD-dependent epimerase/dehydratase family protein [Paraflavisolibacter caeni]MCU7552398.1 NAD-dependent epimerase/dehydratase family protein [Paraflavisolibacter caeni]
MQTILGAKGAIGTGLAKELTSYANKIRLVSRRPKKVNDNDFLFAADLTKPEEADEAIAGSEIVYLAIGTDYNTKVWQQVWPLIMRNVIDACKKHNAKLVFFDNMYMYDPDYLNNMTEDTPIRPVSKKGVVRAEIAQMLLNEVKTGALTAMIVRSADFIGVQNSALTETVVKNLLKRKKAIWFANVNKLHSYTFIPDAARGTAILGNTPDAYNQVWHLPTINEPLTGKQWIELFAKEAGVKPRYQVLSKNMMGILGLFVPVLKELKEMVYQYELDYVFDSSKFEERFQYKPVSPQEAVAYVVRELKKEKAEAKKKITDY